MGAEQTGTPQETGGTRPNESGTAQQSSTPPAAPYVVERGSGASVVWPQPDSQ